MQLQTTLQSLQLSSSSPPTIVIAGDFNLPSINWSDNGATVLPLPTNGRELNSLCLELMDDSSLEQLVYQPTRQGNILDIVLTTDPDMISDIDIVPGISDHEVICFDINLQSSLPSDKIPHFVYLYHKRDLDSVKQDMNAFHNTFISSNPECNSVDANWNSFKEALANSVSCHIPRKKITARKDLPWINQDIKKAMKNCKRSYDRAKQHNTGENWSAYRKARKQNDSICS